MDFKPEISTNETEKCMHSTASSSASRNLVTRKVDKNQIYGRKKLTGFDLGILPKDCISK